MIYLVTNQKKLFTSKIYETLSVKESIDLLYDIPTLGVDTETKGIDPHTGKLLLTQFGNYDNQVVVDCSTVDVLNYKPLLESNKLLLFWNAKFDLKWFYKHNIVPKRVYDGYLAEKLMWLGYPIVLSPETYSKIKCDRYDYIPKGDQKNSKAYYILHTSLQKAGRMYLGIELDKSVRGKIAYMDLTDEIIKYSADDVKYLEKIREHQLIDINKKGLSTALEFENRFVLSLAYMEYCGVKIDRNKWLQKMSEDKEQMDNSIKALNRWIINNIPNSKYIERNLQGDLWSGFSQEPKVTINWNSPKQVIPIFKGQGVNVESLKKDSEEDTESIEAKVLLPQKDKCSLIPIYLKYKEEKKVVATYGENVLKQININTNRLHTNFNSLGADTGRISSGGKDKANKVKYINFLNIPRNPKTRSCFVAEEGNKWISIDYSGQESVIMASMSNDKEMIKELMEGSKDLHSLTAYISFMDIPRNTKIEDIKILYPELRQRAKSIEFAINYGGNALTISENDNIDIKEANEIYNNYTKGFYGLKKYQDFRRKDWVKKGYIDLNPLIGYKAYIYDYSYLKELEAEFNKEGFWDKYRRLKKISPKSEIVEKVKYYFKRKADSERQSINYPMK